MLPPTVDDVTTDYPNDLYRSGRPATFVATVDEIGSAELARFTTDGYIAVRSVLEPQEITDVLDGLSHVLAAPGQADIKYE